MLKTLGGGQACAPSRRGDVFVCVADHGRIGEFDQRREWTSCARSPGVRWGHARWTVVVRMALLTRRGGGARRGEGRGEWRGRKGAVRSHPSPHLS